jgi:hypothetical protein
VIRSRGTAHCEFAKVFRRDPIVNAVGATTCIKGMYHIETAIKVGTNALRHISQEIRANTDWSAEKSASMVKRDIPLFIRWSEYQSL